MPGTWHDSDLERPVAIAVAKDAWTSAARPILLRVASQYHATIRYQDLAEQLQAETGYRTRMLFHYWIGDVLGRVGRECHARKEPLLSSLCVDASGSVGPGYGVALTDTYGGPLPDDLDAHAALERLRCYQRFGADLPPDGGESAFPPALQRSREWRRQEQARTAPKAVCPTCHIRLPLTGVCDNCP